MNLTVRKVQSIEFQLTIYFKNLFMKLMSILEKDFCLFSRYFLCQFYSFYLLTNLLFPSVFASLSTAWQVGKMFANDPRDQSSVPRCAISKT